jgi:hypothetical protein
LNAEAHAVTPDSRLDEAHGTNQRDQRPRPVGASVAASTTRVEAALRAFDRRVPARGAELRSAVCDHVRASRDAGVAAGPLLVDLNEMVSRVLGDRAEDCDVDDAAGSGPRRVGLDAVMDQVVRWSLDEYYRGD